MCTESLADSEKRATFESLTNLESRCKTLSLHSREGTFYICAQIDINRRIELWSNREVSDLILRIGKQRFVRFFCFICLPIRTPNRLVQESSCSPTRPSGQSALRAHLTILSSVLQISAKSLTSLSKALISVLIRRSFQITPFQRQEVFSK